MLVFLSHYPEDVTDVRDGMTQRIAAIDSIFKNVERVYLNISFRRHKRHRVRTQGLVRVETVNFYLHHRSIVQWLRRARFVYIHSIHNAIFIMPYFRHLGNRLIVDLHGIVPEETMFRGKRNWARVLGLVEKDAVRNSGLIIAVTQKMVEHLLGKYPGRISPTRILVLPNVEFRARGVWFPRRRVHDGIRLIYAGTVGNWQKTDLMLQTLQRVKALDMQLLARLFVHQESVVQLQKKVTQLGLNGSVTVDSLSHDEILKEYQSADAGFVLRDEILLNKVAMPTKLVEYMTHGVVPIVLSPDIGDFLTLGYRFLTIDDLFDKEKLNFDTLERMRAINFTIVTSLSESASEAKHALASFVEGKDVRFSPGARGDVAGVGFSDRRVI